MPLVLIEGPDFEPVELAHFANFVRRNDTLEDDEMLTELLKAAREHIEEQTGRCFVSQQWLWTDRNWPCDGIIRLPKSPIIEVEEVSYIDASGATVTLTNNTDYIVDLTRDVSTIEPPANKSWPMVGSYADAVQVLFSAGYIDTTGSPGPDGKVPARAKIAIQQLAAHWFDNREPVVTGTIATKIPLHVERLISGLRLWNA